jgi:hypothetical protein
MELHAQIACNLPLELMKKGVGWQDRAVYVEACLFCRKELTDGILHRELLAMWMPDMSPKDKAKRLDRMRQQGALIEHGDGWAFPLAVWAKWGIMRADVDAKREAEAKRKSDYRARLSQRDMNGTEPDARVTATHPSKQPEPEPEPEPEPYISTQDSYASDDAVIHRLRIGGETAW